MQKLTPTAIDLHTEDHATKGILICAFGYLFTALFGVFEKMLSPPLPITTILFFQSLICLLLITPKVLHAKINLTTSRNWHTLIIRIIAGMSCYALLFYMIKFIPIAQALLYQYSASLWLPLVSFIWLRVRMSKRLWSGIIIGFIGILFILQPHENALYQIAGFGILCAIMQAISVVAIRKLLVTEPPGRILFQYFFASTLIFLPFFLKNGVHLSGKNLFLVISIGICTYLAQKFITVSLKYAHPTTLGPICYTSILFAGIFEWLFWHEVPKGLTLLGMAFVIGGCLLTVFLNQSRPSATIAAGNEKVILEN